MAQNPLGMSLLDPGQIIKRVYDETNDRIRVTTDATVNVDGEFEINLSHLDDSVRVGDGTSLITSTNVSGKQGLDVNVIAGAMTGEFTQTGLRTAIKITTMTVGDVATPIPAVPLTGRNSLVVTNYHATEILYVGPSNVTANRVVGTTSGHEVNPGEGFNLDIQDDIILYGRAEAGETILIKVTELA